MKLIEVKSILIRLSGYDPEAYESANQYLQKAGLPALQYHEPVKSDPVRGKEIARAYEQMKHEPENPEVIKAYKQFAKEVEAQWEHLPVKVEFTDQDPYRNSKEMFEDVMKNKRLKVFRGGEPHGFLSAKDKNGISVNEKFRAVHDYFGHFMAKYQFGASGEQNAYLEHAKMFSPLARKVMATETMGQNSWFNYSDTNEGKHPKERQFAEQKAGFLPEEYLK
jgi:hypothetical protein